MAISFLGQKSYQYSTELLSPCTPLGDHQTHYWTLRAFPTPVSAHKKGEKQTDKYSSLSGHVTYI